MHIPKRAIPFPRATDGARPAQEVRAEISHNGLVYLTFAAERSESEPG